MAVGAVLLLATGCSGKYVGAPRAEVLSYQTFPTYGGLHALATAYARSINDAVKADTLHPGMYAEYGVTLALMGHKDQACRMLNAEAKAFPESALAMRRLKERLMPDMVEDTLVAKIDTANMQLLASWAYDSLTALKPLPYVAPVIDSTDTAWVQVQTPVDSVPVPVRLTANQKRELLAQQQAAEGLRKKAIEDSIAAAKQAKIDERNKEKADREEARKTKEKAKEEERKAKEKAKEEERKAREKAKEEERIAKEKAKEEDRVAKEKAKEEERIAKEKAKEEERAAKEKAKEEAKQERQRQAEASKGASKETQKEGGEK